MVLADPPLLPPGAQQPVRAETLGVLAAHLAGVLWGDRVQTRGGALTTCQSQRGPRPQREPRPQKGSAQRRPRPQKGPAQQPAKLSAGTRGGRYLTPTQLRDWRAESLPEVPPLAGRGASGIPPGPGTARHFLLSLGRGTQPPAPRFRQHRDRPWP